MSEMEKVGDAIIEELLCWDGFQEWWDSFSGENEDLYGEESHREIKENIGRVAVNATILHRATMEPEEEFSSTIEDEENLKYF